MKIFERGVEATKEFLSSAREMCVNKLVEFRDYATEMVQKVNPLGVMRAMGAQMVAAEDNSLTPDPLARLKAYAHMDNSL